MTETRTINGWEHYFSEYNLRVMDPDGFDRSDPDLMSKEFTMEEFMDGLYTSTIQVDSQFFDDIAEGRI